MVFYSCFPYGRMLFLLRSKHEFTPIFGFIPSYFAFPRFFARVFGPGLVFNGFAGLHGGLFRPFRVEEFDIHKPPANLLLLKRRFDFYDFFLVFLVGQNG